jgi:hypothetical protein
VTVGEPRGLPQLNHTRWRVEVVVTVTPVQAVDAATLALESLRKLGWLTMDPFDYLPPDIDHPSPDTEEFSTDLIYEE